MKRLIAIIAIICCAALYFMSANAFALGLNTEAPLTGNEEEAERSLLDEAVEEGVAEEDLPIDEDAAVVEKDAENEGAPSIEGLKPLYTTRIKLMTSTGDTVTIRSAQDTNSAGVGMVRRRAVVTIYKVYPAFVLIEYEGAVGYILRTCIDEYCTVLDPSTTPPYGVMNMGYVATAAEAIPVYKEPKLTADINDIIVGEGEKISIIEFVDGFAKVNYWRSYGYIDVRQLKDLVVVSPTLEPLSEDTPIAAFSSFFAYNTGAAGNDGRCKNIVRSCELMTRTMQPGETLDFNAHIGPYKRTNGYFLAPVLIDGGTQLGSGGGTCQSSSTMYNTIRQLPGISILMRRPHGPGSARYLPQHTDAAVGNANLNLIFRNDYDFPIRILAESKGEGSISIQIFREL